MEIPLLALPGQLTRLWARGDSAALHQIGAMTPLRQCTRMQTRPSHSSPDAPPGERPFFVMVKPVAAACNLACRYCYYLNRPAMAPSRRMARETLEVLVRDTIAAQPEAPEIHFAWQGGEPTLAGLEFFHQAVAFQERYRPAGVKIVNAIQNNGTLIDSSWAGFFAEHRFLVGISIDGP